MGSFEAAEKQRLDTSVAGNSGKSGFWGFPFGFWTGGISSKHGVILGITLSHRGEALSKQPRGKGAAPESSASSQVPIPWLVVGPQRSSVSMNHRSHLAQGTHWAVAPAQAFFGRHRSQQEALLSCFRSLDVAKVRHTNRATATTSTPSKGTSSKHTGEAAASTPKEQQQPHEQSSSKRSKNARRQQQRPHKRRSKHTERARAGTPAGQEQAHQPTVQEQAHRQGKSKERQQDKSRHTDRARARTPAQQQQQAQQRVRGHTLSNRFQDDFEKQRRRRRHNQK